MSTTNSVNLEQVAALAAELPSAEKTLRRGSRAPGANPMCSVSVRWSESHENRRRRRGYFAEKDRT